MLTVGRGRRTETLLATLREHPLAPTASTFSVADVKIERDGTGVCRLTVVTDPIWDAFGFSRLITAALEDGDRIVEIDLTFIPALHSPGLANLVAIYIHAKKRGKDVRLANVSAQNRKVLKATQLDQLFAIV